MFDKTAAYYDRFYSSFKDYDAEAEKVDELIQSYNSGARTVLDVCCGPGRHASILGEKFKYSVDGIDLEPAFIDLVAARIPGGKFKVADMREFDLGRTYDAVVCLFSAIGYAGSTEELHKTVDCLKRHTSPGGVIIVEPWLMPEDFIPGKITLQILDEDDLKMARMSRGELDGKVSRFVMQYLIGDADGVRYEKETHDLVLFTVREMKAAFEANGLEPEYQEEGLTGRGLYVAARP